jgi:hypothetical protein
MARRHIHLDPAGRKIHMPVRADIGNAADAVGMPDDEIGAARGRDGGRRMDLEFGPGPGERLADQRAHLALDEIEHHAAHALLGIVDVFGNLDAAVLADRQDAVVVEQRLGAGGLVRLDHVLEQDAFLDFGGNELGSRVHDSNFALDRRKDADVDLVVRRRGCGDRSEQQHHAGCDDQISSCFLDPREVHVVSSACLLHPYPLFQAAPI